MLTQSAWISGGLHRDAPFDLVQATHVGAKKIGTRSPPGRSEASPKQLDKNLFGQGATIRFYTDTGCTSSYYYEIGLTNSPQCFASGQTFQAFELYVPASPSPSPPPPYPPPPPTTSLTQPGIKKDDNTPWPESMVFRRLLLSLVKLTHVGASDCHASSGSFKE